MEDSFIYETFRPSKVNGLAAFLQKEYPDGEIADHRFLDWEYLRNPAGAAYITTALQSREIVSQYALLPTTCMIDNAVVNATLSLNTLTSSDFRGKGLFTKTAERTFKHCTGDGINFTYGVPNQNSAPGFLRKLGFQSPGELQFMLKPLRPVKMIFYLLRRKQNKKRGSDIPFNFSSKEFNSKLISKWDPSLDANQIENFLSEWHRTNPIAIRRDKNYFKWRYFDCPGRQYYVFQYVKEGEVKAISVVRAMQVFAMPVCVIVDHLAIDDNASFSLLNTIRTIAIGNNHVALITLASHPKSLSATQFKRSGFISVPKKLLPQQVPLILRVHNKFAGSEKLMDLTNWHFSFGDYDLF